LPATARMVVLMSPREKAALEAKARRTGKISAGELVRRAVAAYDSDEASELRTLLDLLATTHAETVRRLDATERNLDETLADLADSGPRP
jgi:signal transduction histidine kinase